MKPNLKKNRENPTLEKKYISEEYLLEALNNVSSCRHILNEDCAWDKSVYCFGCKWWDTLDWVKKVVKDAPGIMIIPYT